jgi:chorismate mutase/prephenate dehydratase
LLERHQAQLGAGALQTIFREVASACRTVRPLLRVGFLGPLHSYSHAAAMAYFGSLTEWVPLPSIPAVFAEVAAGHIDHGLVPLENSTDGRIVDTLSTFVRLPAKICGEVPVRISHCLLAQGPRTKIRRVVSKPQALSQCRGWLAEHLPDVELAESASTTAAAAEAAADPSVAAIASRQAAVEYSLPVLADHIEDNPQNITRFAVLGQHSAARTGHDKTAILFQVDHQPGALADVMAIFKRHGLNLTWIESFPFRREAKQEYLFFLEFEGHEQDLRSRRALTALARKSRRLDVLGSFPQANPS